ncbi:MAG: universal stress protein [Thermoplasmata archaeon]
MTIRSIVVAYDGSPQSVTALDEGADIARRHGARLTIVGAVPLVSQGFGVSLPAGEGVERMLDAARRDLAAQKSRLKAEGVPNVETHLLEGDPVDGVVAYVDKHSIDLVVVGSRGLGAPGRFFLGSVSDGILHHARCSVLVVKSPAVKKSAAP